MIETFIDVEIHCLQPRWVADEKSKYRLYLDDELLTERDWIWEQNIYIREKIVVDVEPNITHTIRLEVIKFNRGYLTQLALRNLNINGIRQDDRDGHRDSLPFVI